MSLQKYINSLAEPKTIEGKIRKEEKKLKAHIEYFKHKLALTGPKAQKLNILSEMLKQALEGAEKAHKLTRLQLQNQCLDEQKAIYDA